MNCRAGEKDKLFGRHGAGGWRDEWPGGVARVAGGTTLSLFYPHLSLHKNPISETCQSPAELRRPGSRAVPLRPSAFRLCTDTVTNGTDALMSRTDTIVNSTVTIMCCTDAVMSRTATVM